MSFVVNTNVASLAAQRQLTKSRDAVGASFEKLSSGVRINRAAEDAAGLAISDRMTAQVRGLNQATRNANDTISVIQIAEGALGESTGALQRMRELSVQAANDTYNPEDRQNLQKEVNQLVSEINRIAVQTQFNNQPLLQGSYSAGRVFHVGANQDQTLVMSIATMTASALGVDTEWVGTTGAVMASFGQGGEVTGNNNQSAANSAVQQIDNALDSVTSLRAALGAFQNRFEAVIANLSSISLNTSVARSRIMDADVASETASLTKGRIIQAAGTAMLAQANQQPSVVLQLLR